MSKENWNYKDSMCNFFNKEKVNTSEEEIGNYSERVCIKFNWKQTKFLYNTITKAQVENKTCKKLVGACVFA